MNFKTKVLSAGFVGGAVGFFASSELYSRDASAMIYATHVCACTALGFGIGAGGVMAKHLYDAMMKIIKGGLPGYYGPESDVEEIELQHFKKA